MRSAWVKEVRERGESEIFKEERILKINFMVVQDILEYKKR